MTTATTTIIDEGGLASWRAAHLSPPAMCGEIENHAVTHFGVATGVGKSRAIDDLLSWPDLYERYDLVIYFTTAHAILDERSIITGSARSPVPWARLQPRPRARCGSLDPEWTQLEQASCSAYAKATLCRTCPEATGPKPCRWPQRLKGLKDVRLVFATEKQLAVNKNLLLLLKTITGAKNTLVILDEARILDASFAVSITVDEMRLFTEALEATARSVPNLTNLARTWVQSLATLRAATESTLGDSGWRFPAALHRFAYWIQREGLRLAGRRFRFLGYDLAHFQYSRPDERWKTTDGTIEFTARPYMGHTLLIAAAHTKPEYLSHRLGLARPAHAPFADVRFKHSQTRIYNLKSRIGALRNFWKNHKQILDFFATLIRRNIAEGRSTVLVSRKTSKDLCARYLEAKLRSWGTPVSVVMGLSAKPARPDPSVVVIEHYGTLGVNTYEDFDCLYCVNSYYISDDILSDRLQEHDPAGWRVELRIDTDEDRNRRAVVVDSSQAHRGIEPLADACLHKLEADRVLQAAGRVRFFTRPREVILFQMADLAPDVGAIQVLKTLEEARQALNVPRAKLIGRAGAVERLQALQREGLSLRAAAGKLGLNKETARRWMRQARLK